MDGDQGAAPVKATAITADDGCPAAMSRLLATE
jgi:hypothetical protein